MSKTIETLKRPHFKEDALYAHIADTYFHQKNRPKARKKKTAAPVKNIGRLSITLLLLIISVILLVTLISFSHNRYTDYIKKKISTMKVIKLVNNGVINKEIIKSLEFRGHAKKGDSKISRNVIILSNPQKYNWADLSINFKFPIDLSSRSLSMSLRGNVGGEKVNIILRDINNRSARLTDMSLPSNWNDKIIHPNKMEGDIDMTKVNHLRIECGYVGESAKEKDSLINVIVYIKNINLTKEM